MNRARLAIIGLSLSGALTAIGCSSKPAAAIEDLTAHLAEAGLAVSAPDPGPLAGQLGALESGINQAAGGGPRPELKTVEIDGVLTTVHRFESEADARRFFEVVQKLPRTDQNLPARFKAALGTPRYVVHKNIVLRMNQGVGGTDDSAKTAAIEQHFRQL
jgi:hypothetical protein